MDWDGPHNSGLAIRASDMRKNELLTTSDFFFTDITDIGNSADTLDERALEVAYEQYRKDAATSLG